MDGATSEYIDEEQHGRAGGAKRRKGEQCDKPDSVFALGANDGHLSGTPVTRRL